MSTCTPCNREFRDQAHFDYHIRHSTSHAHKCATCSEGYPTVASLTVHTIEARHPVLECKSCELVFNAEELLKIHQKSTLHQGMITSPLNVFFRSWSGFQFNVRLAPHQSWDELQVFCCWDEQSPLYRAAWIKYQDAIASGATIWFGKTWVLESWKKICRAVGISPLPKTCAEGDQATRHLFVNIIDLIDWARNDGSNGEVKCWKNRTELFNYSIQTQKIFERDITSSDKHNVVLRQLIHCMFPRQRLRETSIYLSDALPFFLTRDTDALNRAWKLSSARLSLT